MVFEKGNIPWNKGTKGICKPNSGSFKKGNVPPFKGKELPLKVRLKISNSEKGKILSEETKERMRGRKAWNKNLKLPQITGKNHPYWKGGRNKTSDGYIEIYMPNHPFASRNYIREHRLVIEKQLGRYLKPNEVVHHLDGQRNNNKLENLHLFQNAGKHRLYHNFLRMLVGNFIHELGYYFNEDIGKIIRWK